MMRPSVLLATLSMLAACGGLAYYHAERQQSDDGAVASTSRSSQSSSVEKGDTAHANAAKSADAGTESTYAGSDSSSPSGATETTSVPAETVTHWIKDTESPDAKTRAAAIAALADAPTDQALPALKRVLQVGEPNVDRQIALRSIYTLALRDGDKNGVIRDVMRGAIYHSDDDGVTQTAQSLLDDVEAEFAQRTAKPN